MEQTKQKVQVLVVDCNDSFVYNLVQILKEDPICSDVRVANVENISLNLISNHTHILLSPGPKLPKNYPILNEILRIAQDSHSILGVCLGMQAIGEYFNASLKHLSEPKHGHSSTLVLINKGEILQGIKKYGSIGRYHSWVIDPVSIPNNIKPLATDEDGNIMVIEITGKRIFGVQFHPESIISEEGRKIIHNWLKS